MPDRDLATIRDLIYYQYATIIAKSAFTASDGVQWLYSFCRLNHGDDKKFYDAVPPLLEKKYLKTIYYCRNCSGTLDKGEVDGDGEVTELNIDAVIG